MSYNGKVPSIQDSEKLSNFHRRKPNNRRAFASAATPTTPNGTIQSTGETSASSLDRASLLGSPSGAIDIHGGQFNATAGNHFSVTINAGGVNAGLNDGSNTSGSRQYKQAPSTGTQHRSTQSGRVSGSECTEDNSLGTPPPIKVAQRSCDIYYRHITPKGRGSPLWIPEPNKALNIEYQRAGMRIGDVGIITSRGNFDFLFNICLPADHPINPMTLPDNFAPLVIGPEDIQKYSEFKGESYLSSASIKRSHGHGESSGLLFESSASDGAILAMPVGSKSEDLGNVARFRKYAALHAENWYKYVNNVRGREARNGDIRLVTGYDKTSQWGMATFSNSTAQNDSLHLTFRPKEENSLGRTYAWEYTGMAEVRAGPDANEIKELQMDDPSQEGKTYENQCLFVRTLNIKLQETIWKRLASDFGEVLIDEASENVSYSHASSLHGSLASGGTLATSQSESGSMPGNQPVARTATAIVHEIPRNQADRIRVSCSAQALTGHPSEVLNEMLLRLNSTAQIAITEDRDWISIMKKEDTVIPSKEELLARILAAFKSREEDGVFFLEKRENKPHPPSITAQPLTTAGHGAMPKWRGLGVGPGYLSSGQSGITSLYSTNPSISVLSWTNEDPREGVLFSSWGILYRFQATTTQNGQSITTMWRTLKHNKEDRIAKLEWLPHGGLGRVTLRKNIIPMADLVRLDGFGVRSFNGPDGLQYRWQLCPEGVGLQDPDGETIALLRSTRQTRYQYGDVFGELHYIQGAGRGTVMHPPMMDIVTLSAMLYRYCAACGI